MRLALYAHYSISGDVALHVPYYLRKLHELGFRICFISNSPIPPEKEQELEGICAGVIQRENIGFDFGMWKQAIAGYDLDGVDELLLTNSSIVGPLHPLGPLWDSSTARRSDFWGLTDNDEFGRHLQTYFMVFRRTTLTHPCFRNFWDSIRPMGDRQTIIERHEIGLTHELEQHGLKWGALFPSQRLRMSHLLRQRFPEMFQYAVRPSTLPRNTTMLLPDLLLERGMPFLKAKLLFPGGHPARQISAEFALRLLESSDLPIPIVDELRTLAGLEEYYPQQ